VLLPLNETLAFQLKAERYKNFLFTYILHEDHAYQMALDHWEHFHLLYVLKQYWIIYRNQGKPSVAFCLTLHLSACYTNLHIDKILTEVKEGIKKLHWVTHFV
jgi:hypothetical protein